MYLLFWVSHEIFPDNINAVNKSQLQDNCLIVHFNLASLSHYNINTFSCIVGDKIFTLDWHLESSSKIKTPLQ